MIRPAIIICCLAFCWACTKTTVIEGDPNAPISVEPELVIESVNPLSVKALQDPIEFLLFYRDGNGDLGFYDGDSLSLFITDNRINITQGYYIPPLSPSGSEIAIQGNLKVQMDNTILIDTNSAAETVTFSIRIKDRAGNWSNTATSEPITVNP